MKSIKNFIINSLIYFSFGIMTLGIILIEVASLFMIFKLKTTPPDSLLYQLTARLTNPFDWVFNTIVLGNILAIGGLILLIFMILFKKINILLQNHKL